MPVKIGHLKDLANFIPKHTLLRKFRNSFGCRVYQHTTYQIKAALKDILMDLIQHLLYKRDQPMQ